MEKVRIFTIEGLLVKIYNSRERMGKAAAFEVAHKIQQLLSKKEEINMAFAAAPSQNEFLDELTRFQYIEWNRINAFHLDEYINLPDNAPQKFGTFLYERIFSKLPFKSVNYLNGNIENVEEECIRYSELLTHYSLDIACIGIGENGHIAFNDPHVADFQDILMVKRVSLDDTCRMQQVNDGCFNSIGEVPLYALTMTIPTILSAKNIFCIVPGKSKARAVQSTVKGPISERCPSSILRSHSNSVLYLDQESSSLLEV